MPAGHRRAQLRRALLALAIVGCPALIDTGGSAQAGSGATASVYALAGNAKSVTYGSYPHSHTKGLFDVTEGSNFTPDTACGYLCTAEPGYDGPTGNGTPNGTAGF
jgi:hypothetical protein